MSDNGEVEVENSSYPVLPKDVTDEIGSIKLFNKWSYEDVEIRDISLTYVTAFLSRWRIQMLPHKLLCLD
jgi:small subunit ribosomal protein S5e